MEQVMKEARHCNQMTELDLNGVANEAHKVHDKGPPKSLFADADAMKKKMREELEREQYDVCDFYWETGWAQFIARHAMFEYATLSVIALNAIWISIEADNNKADLLQDADLVFQVAAQFFCTYFTFEWLARFLSFRKKRNCVRDAWFVFDSCLVAMMACETWLFALIFSGGSSGS